MHAKRQHEAYLTRRSKVLVEFWIGDAATTDSREAKVASLNNIFYDSLRELGWTLVVLVQMKPSAISFIHRRSFLRSTGVVFDPHQVK
jgi:hypothetical protein